ncbi:MAG: hypothetical protein AAGC72_05695 [Planctomycetota bacterium]
MNTVTFTIDQLLSMPRPASYLNELARCAVSQTENGMTFDQGGACYLALKTRYARYKPTEEDHQRVAAYKSSLLAGKTPEATLRRILDAYRRGCGGCPGRDIRA